MKLTARRVPGVVDQISVYDGPVRIAVLADSVPEPVLIRGELPKGVTVQQVMKLIEPEKVLKGGL